MAIALYREGCCVKTWAQQDVQTCAIEVPLHSGCHPEREADNQEDPNYTQSSRCAHQAPSSSYNTITP
eukprot:6473847-Amphidinium_carterae.1